MDFKKLSEVDLLEVAPDGVRVLAEVDGSIKRIIGGVGGSPGYVWDVTDKFMDAAFNTGAATIDENNMLTWNMTREEALDLISKADAAGGLITKIDFSVVGELTNKEVSGVYLTSGPVYISLIVGDSISCGTGVQIGGTSFPFVAIRGDASECVAEVVVPQF